MTLISKIIVSTLVTAACFAPGNSQAGYISLTEGTSSVSIFGGDYEFGLQANGQNIDNGSGAPLTVSLGTPISFSGTIIDDGATTASSTRIFVLPFAGSSFAISDLTYSYTATASNRFTYDVSGLYNSQENLAVPNGANTIVAGAGTAFNSPFSSNSLVTTAVPEPTSMTLLGAALAGAWLVRRRKQSQSAGGSKAQA